MITLAAAARIVDAALAEGRRMNLPPLSAAVLDAAGCLVAFKREDNSSLLREHIAQGKAYGCLAMGVGGRVLAERARTGPAFIAAATTLAQGRLVPVPGGVLIRDAGGKILGAVGVTGAASDEDEACAVAGITAEGLTPDTGATA